MGDAFVARMLELAQQRQAEFQPSRVGRGDGRVDTKERVSLRFANFDKDFRAEIEPTFTSAMMETAPALGVPPFTPVRAELELVAYGDGDFQAPHLDTQTRGARDASDRAMTAVYYFYATPKAFQGGEFRLFSMLPPEQGGSFVDVAPESDTLVLFPSWARHEVRPLVSPGTLFGQSRFALIWWFHRRRDAQTT
ncbi:MAG TPA: 2OG-Fe(II) oxygenase [Magnetospirillum sp.]|nr:2OG-Fe(II) oxygenase [Magnetospirillum sp.]